MSGPVVEMHTWKSYSEEQYEKARGTQDVSPQVHYFRGVLGARAGAQQVHNGDLVIVDQESGTTSYYKSFGALTDKGGTLQQRLSTAYESGDPDYQMKVSDSTIKKPLELNLVEMAWERIKSREKQSGSKGSNAEKGILVLQGPAEAVEAKQEQRRKALAAEAEAETKEWTDVENIVEDPEHDARGGSLAGLKKWEMVKATKQGTDGKTMFSSQEKPNVKHFHDLPAVRFSVKNTFVDDLEEQAPSPNHQRCQSVPPRRQDE